ncbi:MAG: hypothetical protein U0183_15325 [Polyangiaceae bacterium]
MSHAATAERPQNLLDDQRGAIMIMGLFMATMIIGAMWYMKGIGDAIVFRDRMQESADHVVFSAAAVHARGMNLISIINIVMYVLTIIHVVLAVLKYAAYVCAALIVTAEVCLPIAQGLEKAEKIYDNTVIKVGLPALSGVGTVVAVGYPWYGSYAGYNVGSTYKTMGVAVGASNIPGLSFSLPLGQSLFPGKKSPVGGNTNQAGNIFSKSGSGATKGNGAEFSVDMKLGLPVTLAENSELCDRAIGVVADFAGPLSFLIEWIGGAADDCDGFPWETKAVGWKKMYGQAKNGNMWLQVWSFAFPEQYDENFAESRVALAIGGTKGPVRAAALKGSQVSPPTYFAQSEFYYDCEKKWDDDSCNGEETEATFGMRWRARLRPVTTPDIMGALLGALGDGLLGGLIDFAGDAAAERIKQSKVFRDATASLTRAARGLGSSLGGPANGALGDALDTGVGAIGDLLKDAIGGGAGAGTAIPSVLH